MTKVPKMTPIYRNLQKLNTIANEVKVTAVENDFDKLDQLGEEDDDDHTQDEGKRKVNISVTGPPRGSKIQESGPLHNHPRLVFSDTKSKHSPRLHAS